MNSLGGLDLLPENWIVQCENILTPEDDTKVAAIINEAEQERRWSVQKGTEGPQIKLRANPKRRRTWVRYLVYLLQFCSTASANH
jgi:hypothetical protein